MHRTQARLGNTLVAAAWLVALLAGCSVGPDYQRPRVALPRQFRGAPSTSESAASLADQGWWQVFDDPALRQLLELTLRQNADAQIAAARVSEAQAALGGVDAERLPALGAQASLQGSQALSQPGSGPASTGSASLGLALSWEIDFWGKYRRASEAARADLLASEWGRRATWTSLVSQVASTYFSLRALDQQQAVAERACEARRRSLELTRQREHAGAGSLLDVRQAEEALYAAEGERVDLARRSEQHENRIASLLGASPGPIERTPAERPLHIPAGPPAGLPSTLLERRPDVHVAEAELMAASARVGVAAAARFPALSLTGTGGVVSGALGAFFSAPALVLGAGASLIAPVLDGGRVTAGVGVAEARERQAELLYQRSVQQALREVSDALVGLQRGRQLLGSREALLAAARDARGLAELRYQGGSSSYLEVLDGDTRLLDAELSLVQARLDTLLAYVELYRALGGGWQA